MDSIVEYFTYLKGIEYLIAIGFIIAFIAFWMLVFGRGKGRWITIAVLMYLVVGIVIVLGSCVRIAP